MTILRSSIFLLFLLLLIPGCDLVLENTDYPTGEPRKSLPAHQFNFMILGDWGRKGEDIQKDVAKQLGIDARDDSSRFVISTGDNFYDSGVESLTDEHWQKSFEDVYTADALQIPWYVILGNHDHRGNVQAQVDYSQIDNRWIMPAPYFSREFMLEDSTTALFVFLDTTPLEDEIVTEDEFGQPTDEPALQLKWLAETLATSTADWRLVFGHHPLYSVGYAHGDSPSMQANLEALFEKYGVQAYFSGHAHNLQHLKPAGSVHYFVSGAGSRARKSYTNEITLSSKSVPGYMAASLTADTLFVQFADFKGEMHHTAKIGRITQ